MMALGGRLKPPKYVATIREPQREGALGKMLKTWEKMCSYSNENYKRMVV